MQHENYAKLLSLNYNLFDIIEYQELVDFIVNDSHKLVPYQLAVVYSVNNNQSNSPEIVAISGTLSQETDVNFNHWLIENIKYFHTRKNILDFREDNNDKKLVYVFYADELPDDIKNSWALNLGQEVQIAKLYANNELHINLILYNKVKLDEEGVINLNFITKSYRQALLINLKDKSSYKIKNIKSWQVFKIAMITFGVCMFIPIKPSVMAPAEIISEQIWSVNSPINGIIKNIDIEPNSNVSTDTVLFKFDTIDLKNNLRLKQHELKKLETEQSQARALGFQDLEERAKIFRLNQDIAAKKQEISYANEQFDLSIVKSPSSGTVLYKDKNDLVGKPVKIGETIMRIADINSQLIEIWLNINDSLKLEKNMVIYYYSNQSPFTAVPAILKYYSHEAYITPTNEVAFRLIAHFESKDNDFVIGDHGQVKIYSNYRTLLGLFIFQKPIATFRKWLYRTL